MKNPIWMIIIALIIGFILGWIIPRPMAPTATTGMSQAQVNLQSGLHRLWIEHVAWTRMYIIAALDSAPYTDKVAARLLKNQDDLGGAIAPYYGSGAGQQLAKLLKEHIMIAAAIVTAAKKGDMAGVNAGEKKWTANADALATFLSGANPNWPKADLLSMLQRHLDLTTKETVDHLQKKWADEIATYDKIEAQALMMADALAMGIVKQFPEKF